MPGAIILICGLPGAGKSTLAGILAKERDAIYLSPDPWIDAIVEDEADVVERDRLRDPVENLQWDLAQQLLSQGLTVILDNGFWAEEERSQYAMRALEIGSRIELIYLEAEPGLLWNRIQTRNSALERNLFRMTREEVEEGWSAFQPPQEDELRFYDDWRVLPQAFGS